MADDNGIEIRSKELLLCAQSLSIIMLFPLKLYSKQQLYESQVSFFEKKNRQDNQPTRFLLQQQGILGICLALLRRRKRGDEEKPAFSDVLKNTGLDLL